MAETALIAIIGVVLVWLIFFVMPRINKERRKKLEHVEIIALSDLSVGWTKLNGQRERMEQPVPEDQPVPEEQDEQQNTAATIYELLSEVINVPDEKGYYRAFTQDGEVFVHMTGLKYALEQQGMESTAEEVNILKDSLGGAEKYVRYIDGKRDKSDQYVRLPAELFGELMEFEVRKPEAFSIILQEK